MNETKHPDENELPIIKYKDEIVQKIRDFPIVLITGETGCGKVSF